MNRFIDSLLIATATALKPHFRRLDIDEALDLGDFETAQKLIDLNPEIATAEQRKAAADKVIPR